MKKAKRIIAVLSIMLILVGACSCGQKQDDDYAFLEEGTNFGSETENESADIPDNEQQADATQQEESDAENEPEDVGQENAKYQSEQMIPVLTKKEAKDFTGFAGTDSLVYKTKKGDLRSLNEDCQKVLKTINPKKIIAITGENIAYIGKDNKVHINCPSGKNYEREDAVVKNLKGDIIAVRSVSNGFDTIYGVFSLDKNKKLYWSSFDSLEGADGRQLYQSVESKQVYLKDMEDHYYETFDEFTVRNNVYAARSGDKIFFDSSIDFEYSEEKMCLETEEILASTPTKKCFVGYTNVYYNNSDSDADKYLASADSTTSGFGLPFGVNFSDIKLLGNGAFNAWFVTNDNTLYAYALSVSEIVRKIEEIPMDHAKEVYEVKGDLYLLMDDGVLYQANFE